MPSSTKQPTPTAETDNIIIEYPGSPANDDAVCDILERGNVPLLVGDDVVAEVANSELNEGLDAAQDLSNAELMSLSSGLAENINHALSAGNAELDVAELAADAAALFVLCLRRNNMLDIDNLPACSVSFDGKDSEARLTLAG